MERLIITINGEDVKIEVEDAKGSHCIELTQAIERLMGEVKNKTLKKEFFALTKIQEQIHSRVYAKNHFKDP